MRPLRLLCTVAFFIVVAFLILLSLVQPISTNNNDNSRLPRTDFRSRRLFGTPSSLFPPSAIISLTDDNTTFFLSRPALYGPLLPHNGLAGQLWVGSGFGDDTLVRGGMIAVGQAELGCSDIPGWSEERAQLPLTGSEPSNPTNGGEDYTENREDKIQHPNIESQKYLPEEDDDTDNFLHYPLSGSQISKNHKLESSNIPTEHADIQSIQESAEIAGKIVLLSRGGCGFLEKTKWVQRRGGVALVVGDYTRGGHLIQMSSQEDTSNVTIPSIFTAYTSAHLLSSLVPSKSSGDSSDLGKGKKQQKGASDRAPVVPLSSTLKITGISKSSQTQSEKDEDNVKHSWPGTVMRKIGLIARGIDHKSSRRPPSSGTISWVQSQDWDDDRVKRKTAKNSGISTSKVGGEEEEDFVIGVHDWRDPDMLAHSKEKQGEQVSQSKPIIKKGKDEKNTGSSRAPTSGVYDVADKDSVSKSATEAEKKSSKSKANNRDESWVHNMLQTSKDKDKSAKENRKAQDMYRSKIAPQFIQDQEFDDEDRKSPLEHEGLWITITPTSASTSPLFDTLLVLVVSPLITLSIVYVMLLLRSRIRRRRWRAPRSLVERLPVRTYHTMSYSSSNSSTHLTSPQILSPSTPLLPQAIPRSRPRSATVSAIRQEAASSLETATALLSTREKASPSNIFQRKYKGRQIECVVCLEEYIDGQSQVMSLPCGHEFHAECMYVVSPPIFIYTYKTDDFRTPWLTTRRRTCPICKGDVVRSMDSNSTPLPTSASSSYTSLVLLGPPHSPRPLAQPPNNITTFPLPSDSTVRRPSPIIHPSDPNLQASIAQIRNDSPSSAIPIPSSTSIAMGEGRDESEDIAATLVGSRQSGDGIYTPPLASTPTSASASANNSTLAFARGEYRRHR